MLPWQEELIAWLVEEDRDHTYLSIERIDHEPVHRWRVGIFRETDTGQQDVGGYGVTLEDAWRSLNS